MTKLTEFTRTVSLTSLKLRLERVEKNLIPDDCLADFLVIMRNDLLRLTSDFDERDEKDAQLIQTCSLIADTITKLAYKLAGHDYDLSSSDDEPAAKTPKL